MANQYFSRDCKNVDMKSASYVKAYIFPSHIEATGVTYARHWKTKAELQKEIDKLKTLPISQEEYEIRFAELQNQLKQRKQRHPP